EHPIPSPCPENFRRNRRCGRAPAGSRRRCRRACRCNAGQNLGQLLCPAHLRGPPRLRRVGHHQGGHHPPGGTQRCPAHGQPQLDGGEGDRAARRTQETRRRHLHHQADQPGGLHSQGTPGTPAQGHPGPLSETPGCGGDNTVFPHPPDLRNGADRLVRDRKGRPGPPLPEGSRAVGHCHRGSGRRPRDGHRSNNRRRGGRTQLGGAGGRGRRAGAGRHGVRPERRTAYQRAGLPGPV
ncbi:Conserved membrane protein in copper uptake, YcnI, partial [Arthrobacter sp. DR-2P]